MANHEDIISKRLDEITGLLKQLIAISLYKENVPMGLIAKNLRTSKTNVVQMLKGIKKDKKNG
ncbi:MAG: hypothetical protein ABSG82_10045 [Sedimentisphaerales bacterium]|jgi:hypothetical protein